MPRLFTVSRKPLLFLIFVSVFVFLYYVASSPKVASSMEPQAYYKDYDEVVCLPKNHLERRPPTKKAKAAMVILVRNK